MNRAIVAVLASFLILFLSFPAQAFDMEEIGLESGDVEKVSAAELDDMRGRYFGFYFAINFIGYWDTVGSAPSAMLAFKAGSKSSNVEGVINLIEKGKNHAQNTGTNTDTSGNSHQGSPGNNSAGDDEPQGTNGSNTSVALSGGSQPASDDKPAVKTSAIIGGSTGAGANGILQLTQVPGSKNFVYSGIVFNLLIVNIAGLTISAMYCQVSLVDLYNIKRESVPL